MESALRVLDSLTRGGGCRDAGATVHHNRVVDCMALQGLLGFPVVELQTDAAHLRSTQECEVFVRLKVRRAFNETTHSRAEAGGNAAVVRARFGMIWRSSRCGSNGCAMTIANSFS
jgi:hypothetical protein